MAQYTCTFQFAFSPFKFDDNRTVSIVYISPPFEWSMDCISSVGLVYYLKVTIICRYIFLRFWLKTYSVSTKFCDLYVEMVQGRQILMFYALIDNDCRYKILRFWANPQKYQTLVPAKNSHLKVSIVYLIKLEKLVFELTTDDTLLLEVANKLYKSPLPLYSEFASDVAYEKLSFIQQRQEKIRRQTE